MPQIIYPVTFNNVDLTSVTGVTVLAANSYVSPKRDVVINDIVRSSTSKVSTGFYGSKDITVGISIVRGTRALAEASLNSLLALVQGLEKDLILHEAGERRRYTATYTDYVIKTAGGSYIELDLVFACSDRHGYSLQYEQLLDATGRSLYNYTDSFTVGGNADAQVPIITAFLSALTAATTNIVTVGNPATNRFITVSRTWVAGDRLIVDCLNRTVKVNGSNVDFTGAFPEWTPGVGYHNYQDNFTTRTLALSIYYYRRYV